MTLEQTVDFDIELTCSICGKDLECDVTYKKGTNYISACCENCKSDFEKSIEQKDEEMEILQQKIDELTEALKIYEITSKIFK
jgi:transcription elongation factor Elf1